VYTLPALDAPPTPPAVPGTEDMGLADLLELIGGEQPSSLRVSAGRLLARVQESSRRAARWGAVAADRLPTVDAP
jgi:hypothetical protein